MEWLDLIPWKYHLLQKAIHVIRTDILYKRVLSVTTASVFTIVTERDLSCRPGSPCIARTPLLRPMNFESALEKGKRGKLFPSRTVGPNSPHHLFLSLRTFILLSSYLLLSLSSTPVLRSPLLCPLFLSLGFAGEEDKKGSSTCSPDLRLLVGVNRNFVVWSWCVRGFLPEFFLKFIWFSLFLRAVDVNIFVWSGCFDVISLDFWLELDWNSWVIYIFFWKFWFNFKIFHFYAVIWWKAWELWL